MQVDRYGRVDRTEGQKGFIVTCNRLLTRLLPPALISGRASCDRPPAVRWARGLDLSSGVWLLFFKHRNTSITVGAGFRRKQRVIAEKSFDITSTQMGIFPCTADSVKPNNPAPGSSFLPGSKGTARHLTRSNATPLGGCMHDLFTSSACDRDIKLGRIRSIPASQA